MTRSTLKITVTCNEEHIANCIEKHTKVIGTEEHSVYRTENGVAAKKNIVFTHQNKTVLVQHA